MDDLYRTGIGYDTHTVREGGPFRLGGIDIPSDLEPVGHSDADILIHAVIDALLGAAALGDIGDHFPPSDESYRGIDSQILLDLSLERVRAAGFEVVNLDVTVIAEAPRLGPYKKPIAANLSERMRVPVDRINIKATTNEKMGFIGRQEGVAVLATALLRKPVDG